MQADLSVSGSLGGEICSMEKYWLSRLMDRTSQSIQLNPIKFPLRLDVFETTRWPLQSSRNLLGPEFKIINGSFFWSRFVTADMCMKSGWSTSSPTIRLSSPSRMKVSTISCGSKTCWTRSFCWAPCASACSCRLDDYHCFPVAQLKSKSKQHISIGWG